jgi:hypothetical protein
MLDQMQAELAAEGHDVNMLAVNIWNATGNQQQLVDRCDFPLFQDVTYTVDEYVGGVAWDMVGGKKDDFYVYRADGTLSAYLPTAAGNTNLLPIDGGPSPGYLFVKQQILDAE